MEYNFLAIVNHILQMAKQKYVATLSNAALGDDAYNVMICVNDTLQDMSNLLRIKSRMVNFNIETVVGQRVYSIPSRIIYPIYSIRQGVSKVKLRQMNTQEFDSIVPDDESSGEPEIYYFECVSPLEQWLDGYTIFWIYSTSRNDTTQKLTFQGYDNDNLYRTSTGTFTGRTQIFKGIFNSVVGIYKDYTNGTISMHRWQGSPNFYTYYSPNENTAKFVQIGLHPIPSSVMTLQCRGYSRMYDLVNDYDTPDGFDVRMTNCLIMGAYARYLRYDTVNKTELISTTFSSYYDEIRKMLSIDAKNADQHIRIKQTHERGKHGL